MKCAYPPCPVQIESGGEDPPVFCVKHLGVKCSMPHCVLTTIPNSGFCKEHNEWVQCFDFIHGVRHQQAMQQQMEAQQAQAVMNQVRQGVGGNGNVRLLRP